MTSAFNRLQAQLKRANERWDRAMARRGYRDDPDEAEQIGKPFTARDWKLYGWADAWRLLVHRIENDLDRTPELRAHRAVSFSLVSDEPVYAEGEMTAETLALHTKSLRGADPVGKKDPSAKSRNPR